MKITDKYRLDFIENSDVQLFSYNYTINGEGKNKAFTCGYNRELCKTFKTVRESIDNAIITIRRKYEH